MFYDFVTPVCILCQGGEKAETGKHEDVQGGSSGSTVTVSQPAISLSLFTNDTCPSVRNNVDVYVSLGQQCCVSGLLSQKIRFGHRFIAELIVNLLRNIKKTAFCSLLDFSNDKMTINSSRFLKINKKLGLSKINYKKLTKVRKKSGSAVGRLETQLLFCLAST